VARILLFDVDLTLVKTLGAGRGALDQAFGDLFGISEPTKGILFDGRTDRAIFTEALDRHGLLDGDADTAFWQLANAYLERLPAWLGRNEGVVLPGVRELLDALAASHAGVGLATGNIRRGAQAKLGHFGLWERFVGGGFGDERPVRADVVRAAIDEVAAAIGVDPDPADTIIIGDTPLDAEAARAAGARSLCVATGSYSVAQLEDGGADFALPDLSDLDAALAILRS
jgi:phosphoglycolate phosphatase-like HAD superfamily hydrolase